MVTKYYTMFQLLKAAGIQGISPSELAKGLNFKEGSVPSYIWCMENYFGAVIARVKSGRKIVAYRLDNADAVEKVITKGRRGEVVNKVAKAKTVTVKKVAAPKVTKSKHAPVELDSMEIEEITDYELADIKSQLGLV